MHWFYEHEKQRKEQLRTNDIALLNQQLQSTMRQFMQQEEASEQLKAALTANRGRYQTQLLTPWHRGLMEDAEASFELLQALLQTIQYVDERKEKMLWNAIERAAHQLIRIDYSYNQLLGNAYQTARKERYQKKKMD